MQIANHSFIKMPELMNFLNKTFTEQKTKK